MIAKWFNNSWFVWALPLILSGIIAPSVAWLFNKLILMTKGYLPDIPDTLDKRQI